jgi:hypothetical protein
MLNVVFVQDKLKEGFDAPRVSVVGFASTVDRTLLTFLQYIGRGVRIIRGPDLQEDVTFCRECNVYAPTSVHWIQSWFTMKNENYVHQQIGQDITDESIKEQCFSDSITTDKTIADVSSLLSPVDDGDDDDDDDDDDEDDDDDDDHDGGDDDDDADDDDDENAANGDANDDDDDDNNGRNNKMPRFKRKEGPYNHETELAMSKRPKNQ